MLVSSSALDSASAVLPSQPLSRGLAGVELLESPMAAFRARADSKMLSMRSFGDWTIRDGARDRAGLDVSASPVGADIFERGSRAANREPYNSKIRTGARCRKRVVGLRARPPLCSPYAASYSRWRTDHRTHKFTMNWYYGKPVVPYMLWGNV